MDLWVFSSSVSRLLSSNSRPSEIFVSIFRENLRNSRETSEAAYPRPWRRWEKAPQIFGSLKCRCCAGSMWEGCSQPFAAVLDGGMSVAEVIVIYSVVSGKCGT